MSNVIVTHIINITCTNTVLPLYICRCATVKPHVPLPMEKKDAPVRKQIDCVLRHASVNNHVITRFGLY